jgi:hypothetical protein
MNRENGRKYNEASLYVYLHERSLEIKSAVSMHKKKCKRKAYHPRNDTGETHLPGVTTLYASEMRTNHVHPICKPYNVLRSALPTLIRSPTQSKLCPRSATTSFHAAEARGPFRACSFASINATRHIRHQSGAAP